MEKTTEQQKNARLREIGVLSNFRFTHAEVAELETYVPDPNIPTVPNREVLCNLAEKFSQSAERSGKLPVQPKQIWNWFQNRRYATKTKQVKSPGKLSVPPMPSSGPGVVPVVGGKSILNNHNVQLEFEAKSARDGAWYDVLGFMSMRGLDTGNLEARVRFSGFSVEEDEWVNVRRNVRQRSLPCEASECVAVLPGDLILCFQEGKDQALYFDAHVIDSQRRRHDIRGCRCRFLVKYDHDGSEEIVPLRKVCRRPESDNRLLSLNVIKQVAPVDANKLERDASSSYGGSDKTEELIKTEGTSAGNVVTLSAPSLAKGHPNLDATATGKQVAPIEFNKLAHTIGAEKLQEKHLKARAVAEDGMLNPVVMVIAAVSTSKAEKLNNAVATSIAPTGDASLAADTNTTSTASPVNTSTN